MKTRETILDQLRQASAAMDWQALRPALFRLLYAQPLPVQVDAACFPMLEYLATFEGRWPATDWPRLLLADPRGWVERHAGEDPDAPSAAGPADAAFLAGCDGLVWAVTHQDSPGVLTASCAYCAGAAIDAQFVAVWEREDPEAVRIWQGQNEPGGQESVRLLTGRTALDSQAAQRVRRKAWLTLVEHLEQRSVAASGVTDAEALERDLARWTNRHYQLLPD